MTETDKKIELLRKIAQKFNSSNITWALGASMLLYFKGIAPDFHDIDLMISNRDVETVRNILLEMGEVQPLNPNPKYKTKVFMEFRVDSVDIDVMAGFSILCDGVLYDCSLDKEQIVEWLTLGNVKVPLQSPLLWRRYYELMGGKEKVDMIDRALSNG